MVIGPSTNIYIIHLHMSILISEGNCILAKICIDVDHYVTLEMDIDKPYKFHQDVVKRHPPGHLKHKHKGKGKGKWKGGGAS